MKAAAVWIIFYPKKKLNVRKILDEWMYSMFVRLVCVSNIIYHESNVKAEKERKKKK